MPQFCGGVLQAFVIGKLFSFKGYLSSHLAWCWTHEGQILDVDFFFLGFMGFELKQKKNVQACECLDNSKVLSLTSEESLLYYHHGK